MTIMTFALAVAVRTLAPTAGPAALDCAYVSWVGGELSTFSHCAWNDAKG